MDLKPTNDKLKIQIDISKYMTLLVINTKKL